MAHITIEYMIMIPVLVMQIFLFPYAAAVIMGTYEDSLITMELQTTAGHMSSSIQQLYYTMNHGSFSNGFTKINLDVPQLIQGHAYTTTLSHVTSTDTSYQTHERHPQNYRRYRTNFKLGHVGAKRQLARKLGIQQHRPFT